MAVQMGSQYNRPAGTSGSGWSVVGEAATTPDDSPMGSSTPQGQTATTTSGAPMSSVYYPTSEYMTPAGMPVSYAGAQPQFGYMQITQRVETPTGMTLTYLEPSYTAKPMQTAEMKPAPAQFVMTRADIGTRQDIPIFSLPEAETIKYVGGYVRTEELIKTQQLVYEQSPIGALVVAPLLGVRDAVVGLANLPQFIVASALHPYQTFKAISRGVGEFIYKTETASWTPFEVMRMASSTITSIAIGKALTKAITKTEVFSAEKGIVTGTEQTTMGLRYDIDLYGASQAQTSINFMGRSITVGTGEALIPQVKFSGIVLNEPLAGGTSITGAGESWVLVNKPTVEVFGASAGGVLIKGRMQTVSSLGVLAKEEAIPITISGAGQEWTITTPKALIPAESITQIGKGEQWVSKLYLEKQFEGIGMEGQTTIYSSYGKLISQSGRTATGTGVITIIDKSIPSAALQTFSGINEGLASKMAQIGTQHITTSQVAAASSAVASAELKMQVLSTASSAAVGVAKITPTITSVIPKMQEKTAAMAAVIPKMDVAGQTRQSMSGISSVVQLPKEGVKTLPATASIVARQNVTKLVPVRATITKMREITRVIPATTAITKTIPTTTPITATVPVTTTITRTISQPPTFMPPTFPPIYPPIIPPTIGGGLDFGFGRKRRYGKQPIRYTPSLFAAAFNIHGAVNTKKMFSGIEIRPLLSSKRRKKRR